MNGGFSGSNTVQSGAKTVAPTPNQSWIGRLEGAAKSDWQKVKLDWQEKKHVDAAFSFVTLPQQTFVDGIAKPAMTKSAHLVADGAKNVINEAIPVFNKEFIIVGGGLLLAGYVLVKGLHEVNGLATTATSIV